jgi:hypothetical protein
MFPLCKTRKNLTDIVPYTKQMWFIGLTEPTQI